MRVPAEALPLRRAVRGENLACFAPKKDEALISIRAGKPNECADIRFLRMKNLPHGRILSRPRICSLARTQAKQLCPVHSIWPAIADRVLPGELLFP